MVMGGAAYLSGSQLLPRIVEAQRASARTRRRLIVAS
jgi:hypothetical protein